MSFSLTVFAPAFPDPIVSPWREALSEHGLVVQIWPGFQPSQWTGGFLPFSVEVRPNSFPAANRYGTASLLAGFEIHFHDTDPDDMEKLVAEEHGDISTILRTARSEATLMTSRGRSALDLRLQSFAAATLATVAKGLVLDAQQGRCFRGLEAIANAKRESDRFDAQSDPNDYYIAPFPGWTVLEPGQ